MKRFSLLLVLLACGCRTEPLSEEQREAADDTLITILVRLQRMPEIVRKKTYLGHAIEDPNRERDILTAMKAEAVRLGVDPDFVARVFEAQFEAGKTIQRRHAKDLPVPDASPEGIESATLRLNVLRKEIDDLNLSLVQSLANLDLRSAAVKRYIPGRAKELMPELEDDVREIAIKPLLNAQ